MCGIAGIFAYRSSASGVDRDELRHIRDDMAARGPDGSGEWFSEDGRVALGHRRLAIIDLSKRATQPMVSTDGKRIISFNGEIYNYKALRAGLERKGRIFHSDSDTEVLLQLYAEKGESMLHDLRGMFAFILWDTDKHALLLARDPYGIKPIYYADDGSTLRVASQVKSLLAGGKVSKQLEAAGIVGFHLFGSVPEPYTTYREVRALPAGSLLWVDAGGPGSPRSYCSLAGVYREAAERPARMDMVERQHRVREALLDSVRHHLVADVPVGAFLSSGIDSGALIGLMSECHADDRETAGQSHPIRTVTIAFDEFRDRHQDESPLAQLTARRYGSEHTTRVVTEQEFRDDLPRILGAMDQPSIDGINVWFVSKAAREQGLKVAVSGLGGDELFGGYPSFQDIPRWTRWFSAPSKIPGLGDLMCRGYPVFSALYAALKSGRSVLSPKAGGLLKYGATYPGAYLLRRGLFMPWELPAVLGTDLATEGLQRLQPMVHLQNGLKPDPETSFGRVAALEATFYMRNQLLRDTDWASMAHSLEVRVPLVDVTLLQRLAPMLIAGLPGQGKALLGVSPRPSLPAEVGNRRKTGFTTPIGRWLERTDFGARPAKVLAPINTGAHWSRHWALRVAAEWDGGIGRPAVP